MIRERFAPSPTGYLHLGHAYSAAIAFDAAKAAKGQFLVRIEDIDAARCKNEYVDGIYEDLGWLGLSWETPVLLQSERLEAHSTALQLLSDKGLTYRCKCTRKDISMALSAPQEGDNAQFGPDGIVYPGTCRGRQSEDTTEALRLDMRCAVDLLDWSNPPMFQDIGIFPNTHQLDADFLVHQCGDIVLARKDIGTSYHIAVVLDDAYQRITHVTRGMDMAPATQIHVLLQTLLGLETPIYRHHKLVRDQNGKRLAKRHDALALRALRAKGYSAQDVMNLALSSV